MKYYQIKMDKQESGGYTATSPDIKELVTQGDTREEVERNVREVIELLQEDNIVSKEPYTLLTFWLEHDLFSDDE
jgi:predicted RNase H-like HicB family nuclease